MPKLTEEEFDILIAEKDVVDVKYEYVASLNETYDYEHGSFGFIIFREIKSNKLFRFSYNRSNQSIITANDLIEEVKISYVLVEEK